MIVIFLPTNGSSQFYSNLPDLLQHLFLHLVGRKTLTWETRGTFFSFPISAPSSFPKEMWVSFHLKRRRSMLLCNNTPRTEVAFRECYNSVKTKWVCIWQSFKKPIKDWEIYKLSSDQVLLLEGTALLCCCFEYTTMMMHTLKCKTNS